MWKLIKAEVCYYRRILTISFAIIAGLTLLELFSYSGDYYIYNPSKYSYIIGMAVIIFLFISAKYGNKNRFYILLPLKNNSIALFRISFVALIIIAMNLLSWIITSLFSTNFINEQTIGRSLVMIGTLFSLWGGFINVSDIKSLFESGATEFMKTFLNFIIILFILILFYSTHFNLYDQFFTIMGFEISTYPYLYIPGSIIVGMLYLIIGIGMLISNIFLYLNRKSYKRWL